MAHKIINMSGCFSPILNGESTISVNPPYYSTLLPDVVKINIPGVFQFNSVNSSVFNFTTMSESFFSGVGVTEIFEVNGFFPVGKFSGTITENAQPVKRLVRLYLSSTGEFVGETMSAVDGSYSIETSFEGEHYVIAFDDDLGEEYNAVIQDKLIPQNLG